MVSRYGVRLEVEGTVWGDIPKVSFDGFEKMGHLFCSESLQRFYCCGCSFFLVHG